MSDFIPESGPGLPDNYFNNSAARKAKGYGAPLFRAGRAIQSAELMAMQGHFYDVIQGVADGLYNNGDILEGLAPSILEGSSAGNLRIAEGRLYLLGKVFFMGESTLTIPMNSRVSVGIRTVIKTVTDQEDPLLKDPAIGFDNYMEPGAAVVQTLVKWGWADATGLQDETAPEGVFYPIYDIDNGNIIIKDLPPAVTAIIDTVAGYDYTAHGNYAVDGFKVRYSRFEAANAQHASDQYIFTISQGTVHVRGYNVGRTIDTPLAIDINYDVATSETESETYVPNGGQYILTLNRFPKATLQAINGLVELTETLTKGSTGGQDSLVNSSVEYVTEVKQGATVYQSPRDYLLVDGKIDWSPSGSGATEPTSGSYTVKVAVRENLLTNGRGNIVAQDFKTITLTGLVPNTSTTPSIVYVSYTYKLQRVDAITIDREGSFHVIKGRPSLINPAAPPIPDTHTKLALIVYNWYTDPEVKDIRTVPINFDDQQKLVNRVDDLYDLVAQSRLRNDLTARVPADRRGQFVDPFFDNDLRENLLPNDMAIIDGLLTLPISGTAEVPNYYTNSLKHHLLPYTDEIVIDQSKVTACSKINPYQAFEPIPARATISPASDNWIVSSSNWNTQIISNFLRVTVDQDQNATPSINNLTVANSVVTTQVNAGDTIRPQPITFLVEGFGPGEQLVEIRFDGIVFSNIIAGALPFTSTSPADANGKITGSFSIPAGIPTGEKAVEFIGNSSYGDCSFIGMSQISYPVIVRQATRSGRRKKKKRCDPLAETFTLDEDRILTGVDLKFCKRGSGPQIVYVQLRETTVGFPNQEVFAEGIFDMSSLTVDTNGIPLNVWTRINFEIEAHVIGGKEYAIVVMTDDPDHSICIAGIGEYMTPALNGGIAGFVTGQPYQGGEMLSSSNASTWTPHPKQDLTFRLIAAKFTTSSFTVPMGNVSATNISDLVARATVLRPNAECDVKFRFTPTSTGVVYEVSEETPLTLPLRITGDIILDVILTANVITNPNLSPIIYSRPQVVKGTMLDTGNYISKKFNARDLINITDFFGATCVFEYRKQAGATATPKMLSHVRDSGGTPLYASGVAVTEWRPMELKLERALEDGWYEAEWVLPAVAGSSGPANLLKAHAVAPDYTTRIQIEGAGSPANRLYVRQLRVTTKSI